MEDFDLADHSDGESLQGVTSIVFRSHDPGRFSDWHCESRRNYIITVSGEGEIGLGMARLTESARDGLCWSKT